MVFAFPFSGWLPSLWPSRSIHVPATGIMSFTELILNNSVRLNLCYPQYQGLCVLWNACFPKHGRTVSIRVIFSLLTLAQAWKTEWKVDSEAEARDQVGDGCNQTGSSCGDETLFKELVWQDLQMYCEGRVRERRGENECQKLKLFQFHPSLLFSFHFFHFHLLGFTLDLLSFVFIV